MIILMPVIFPEWFGVIVQSYMLSASISQSHKSYENFPNTYRNSLPALYCEIGALKNFAKFTSKQLCRILFFNKVAGPQATLLKKRLWQFFSCKTFKNTSFTKYHRMTVEVS